jgi:hypothetical protein
MIISVYVESDADSNRNKWYEPSLTSSQLLSKQKTFNMAATQRGTTISNLRSDFLVVGWCEN